MSQNSTAPPEAGPAGPGSNLPEYTVSELSASLKRTVEDAFGLVRVRGEISRPKIPGSGHLYLTLKDDRAVLEAVCWRGTVARLSVRPEEGMEVVCVGRLTTYPGRSQYQLIIERMELAGEGALLKLLEDRRRRLDAEGLFDPARKKPLPFLPEVIGVITSPTGAVIRDILHRLDDRFPRHVLLWPVPVQGETAPALIAEAIAGFNALQPDGPVPRPDLLIVARGGGSLEDLMAFNEEVVVRAAAASAIPLIAAVGHETDVTLIDHAADRRAPTPTAAAEMAVPVRADLLADILDRERRLVRCMGRAVADRQTRLDGLGRGLGDPRRLLEGAMQRLDDRAERLGRSLPVLIDRRRARLGEAAALLRHPRQRLTDTERHFGQLGERLGRSGPQAVSRANQRFGPVAARLDAAPLRRRLDDGERLLNDRAARLPATMARRLEAIATRLDSMGQLLESYSYHKVLERGYAVVRTGSGQAVDRAAALQEGMAVTLEFHDGQAPAVIGDTAPTTGGRPRPTPKTKPPPSTSQGKLL
ncbi:MAG: exodeoxyribonuclease VII large subunit [Inquilinaceae bacterium]